MKYLFTLLLTSVILLGCTKNKEYCWKCSEIKSYSDGTEEKKTDTICDKTKDEISDYEEKNTYTVPTGPNSSMHKLTRCSIQ